MMKTMRKILIALPILILAYSFHTSAQNPSDFLPDKPGKWSYSSNIKTPGAEYVSFNKNLAMLAEWFHQNVPMLNKPAGFDLSAVSYGIWNDNYKKNAANFGMRSEMNFDFQLFLSDLARGGKWVVEPPNYSFYINNTEGGHGTNLQFKYFSEQEYDPRGENKYSTSQQKAINDVVTKMNGAFLVFPLKEDIAPGVKLFGDENLVVFNPERPDFWLPVTMKEMTDMYLEYYTLQKDELLLPQLKKEIAEFSEEELNAPAYFGHDTHFVLRANGKNEGMQLMRFNPDYWDRLLPPTAIQFMTFYYPQKDEVAMDESFKNNGHPYYSQLLVNEINWDKLVEEMIERKH